MTALYVHVPFCQSICPYCDFSTWKASTRQHPRWLDLVVREMKLRIPPRQPITTLFLGGGTPSLLSLSSLEKLLMEIRNYLDLDSLGEFTLEVNPVSTEKEKLAGYLDLGVSKISLGVQSFENKNLKILGRLHSPSLARAALEDILNFGFIASLDLMFGIPDQTLKEWERDLDIAGGYPLDHISLYGLTLEENTLFHQRWKKGQLTAASEELYESMYLLASEFLPLRGLQRYEVSNFSKLGRESQHNAQYWDHSPYFALGPGAHSFDGSVRYFNSKKFVDYEKGVQAGCKLGPNNHEKLNQEQLYEEWIWLRLRTREGLELPATQTRFGKIPQPQSYRKWEKLGYVENRAGSNLCLKGKGWLFLDAIAVDCLA